MSSTPSPVSDHRKNGAVVPSVEYLCEACYRREQLAAFGSTASREDSLPHDDSISDRLAVFKSIDRVRSLSSNCIETAVHTSTAIPRVAPSQALPFVQCLASSTWIDLSSG